VRDVSAADCIGLWRRVLLVDAAGRRDTSTDVLWLQGPTGYIDSRGFAGVLTQSQDVFTWRRDVDVAPDGSVDAGRMRWDGDVLIETGVHEVYEEHWVRDHGPTHPAGALLLSADAGRRAVAVAVGDLVGWATAAGATIGPNPTTWQIHGDHVVADGVRWAIDMREGEFHP
jgi:hypothetical protein